ncbi:hypothetical protein [Actinoplanes sp. NPDC049118]|uniref:hypothetical protein n=1 Tax=Actinoplanes sp. NPDC049118 TaxID=3155769 RepID=UPI0033CA72FE
MTRNRSLGPWDVAAPTPNAVLFRHSVLRALFIVVGTIVAAWVLVRLLLSALTGYDMGWDDLGSLQAPLIGAMIGCGGAAWQQRGRPTWIRVSELGIELAQRGDPVFIAWPQIMAVQVRRRWIFAVLEVTPADLYAVRSALPSRDLPAIRYRRGVAMFRIEIGMIQPGRSALRAAIGERHPANRGTEQPQSPIECRS